MIVTGNICPTDLYPLLKINVTIKLSVKVIGIIHKLYFNRLIKLGSIFFDW